MNRLLHVALVALAYLSISIAAVFFAILIVLGIMFWITGATDL